MPVGPNVPSISQILDLAASFGFEMNEIEAASYQRLMQRSMYSYRRLEVYPEFKPPVKYPREPGYRPSPEENPFNAWYVKTDIKGADDGPLAGAKVGIKDAICVAGVPMMNGSRILEGFIPDVDATVVTRLLDAGATIAGKTHTEDYSLSGNSHTCALGPVRNPHKPTHTPGASSSGSAAAIAAGDVELALGGDTAGSIRIPACWTGVIGLKPTNGLVPYTGAVMIEMTMETLGPMTNTVENAARMLSVIVGPDGLDPRQGAVPTDFVRDYLPAIGMGCRGIKIAVLKEGFGHPTWPDQSFSASEEVVDRKVLAAVKALELQGATAEEVSVPMHFDGAHIWKAIQLEGATQFMVKGNNMGTNWEGFYNTHLQDAVARGFRSRPNDLPITVKGVSMLGEYMTRFYHGHYYAKAQNLRYLLRKAYDDVLASYDVIALPTIPFRAVEIAPSDCSIEDTMFYAMHNMGNTCQFNVTGHPAINVPCGMEDDLPIGMMLVGRQFDDFTLLRVADAFERIGDWKGM